MRRRYPTKREAQEDGWLTLTEAKARAEEAGELATDQRPQGRETEYGYGLWLIRGDGTREEVASAGVSLTEVTNAAGKRGAVLQMVRREELEEVLQKTRAVLRNGAEDGGPVDLHLVRDGDRWRWLIDGEEDTEVSGATPEEARRAADKAWPASVGWELEYC